jgi:glycerol-3-phosphate dehydrogenase
MAARGTHLILEQGLLEPGKGILISSTSDGRLVFVLPYKGYTMIGTTDHKDEPSLSPEATESEIEFLKTEGKKILGENYDFTGKIKSVWAG